MYPRAVLPAATTTTMAVTGFPIVAATLLGIFLLILGLAFVRAAYVRRHRLAEVDV